jgi:hypothetical protein
MYTTHCTVNITVQGLDSNQHFDGLKHAIGTSQDSKASMNLFA